MESDRDIHVLPLGVANKIAAGEVVDRPASVLKELIENSLDAGATRIDIDIAAGGRKLVAVSDNGCGLNRDNALLAIERHATSKIVDVDDIEHISTLGFRGEALAAISSVSRFKLVTAKKDGAGTEIIITGGKLNDVRDIGAPSGTLIEVRDLFFNVPARRKFLRTQQTELSHLRSFFISLALSCPAISMSMTIDGRETYRLVGGSGINDRIIDLFGIDYFQNLKSVQKQVGEIEVTGYVSLPSASRSDRNEQYIFINGRLASAPVLGYSIKEGYHTLVPSGRFPSVFLFVKMDPAQVDVNVHPTKKEVRFRHSGEVRDAVIDGIRDALAVGGAKVAQGNDLKQFNVGDTKAPSAFDFNFKIENLPELPAFKYPGLRSPVNHEAITTLAVDEKDSGGTEEEPSSTAPWSFCRVLGQIGGLYVVLETEDGYVMMDPHAAHERVLYERFMTDISEHSVNVQNLLMPQTAELGPKDALRVRKNISLFKEMGFGISEFGGDSFVVDALPSYFSGMSALTLLVEVSHELEQAGSRGGKERLREDAIAQAACKAAVKARDSLTLQEIEKLVVDLAACKMPYTCPHGRPTMIYTSFKELNKKFGRE